MKKSLTEKEITKICKEFIKGQGYACKLSVSIETKDYLLKK